MEYLERGITTCALSLRLKRETKDKLTRYASKHDCSKNLVINTALEEFLEEKEAG